jgi:hypothetical protein
MKNGDVVTVVTTAGEYVGKLYENQGETVVLKDPRMLVMGETGMGFARGICMTGVENPAEATFGQIVLMTPTNKEVESAWRQHTSGIIV